LPPVMLNLSIILFAEWLYFLVVIALD